MLSRCLFRLHKCQRFAQNLLYYHPVTHHSRVPKLLLSTSGCLLKKINMSEDELKKKLTDEQYYVTREKGTEAPFSGKYYDHHETGVYTCICCGAELFSSNTKYESGSGWPSFYDTIKYDKNKSHVEEHSDSSHGMRRTEVTCQKCDGHLGHVFPDGPRPTGLRYCINSASLAFKPEKK